jgi:predicted TIM-barrel fold metal-dependent hydrolase
MVEPARAPEWIDSDAHILEQPRLLEYLDHEFRDRLRLVPMTDDPEYRMRLPDFYADNIPFPNWLGWDSRQQSFDQFIPSLKKKYAVGSAMDPDRVLADLELEGLDRIVIYPTLWLFATWLPRLGAKFSGALARAYNDYLHDFCSADRRRLIPVVSVALHDVDEAIREVKRNAARGFVGVFLRPNPIYGRTLGHPDYWPLYQVMDELGMTLGLHEGMTTDVPTLGLDRTLNAAGHHVMSHTFEMMAALISLLDHGVLARFPKMKVLFLEAGVGWLPYWLKRLDDETSYCRTREDGRPALKPSEYFLRQCFVTCEVDDPFLRDTIKHFGDQNILLSTDYGHDESHYPHSDAHFRELDLPEESRRRIGRENAYSAYPRLR